MNIRHRRHHPKVASAAYVAPTAVLVGNVEVGARSRIMYGAVLDSEGAKVSVGANSIICENAVIRATAEGSVSHPVLIDDHVFVGPHATLLGCTLDACVYVATGATVLQAAKVGSNSIIAVGALVHADAVIPKGSFVPPHNIAIGDPCEVFPPSTENLADRIRAIGFPTAAFGITRDPTKPFSLARVATEVRSREFEEHLSDTTIE